MAPSVIMTAGSLAGGGGFAVPPTCTALRRLGKVPKTTPADGDAASKKAGTQLALPETTKLITPGTHMNAWLEWSLLKHKVNETPAPDELLAF